MWKKKGHKIFGEMKLRDPEGDPVAFLFRLYLKVKGFYTKMKKSIRGSEIQSYRG